MESTRYNQDRLVTIENDDQKIKKLDFKQLRTDDASDSDPVDDTWSDDGPRIDESGIPDYMIK